MAETRNELEPQANRDCKLNERPMTVGDCGRCAVYAARIAAPEGSVDAATHTPGPVLAYQPHLCVVTQSGVYRPTTEQWASNALGQHS